MRTLQHIKNKQLFWIGLTVSFFATLFFGSKTNNDISRYGATSVYADIPTVSLPENNDSNWTEASNYGDDDGGN